MAQRDQWVWVWQARPALTPLLLALQAQREQAQLGRLARVVRRVLGVQGPPGLRAHRVATPLSLGL